MNLKKLSPRMIIILVLIGLLIIFSVQNSEMIQVNFFFWHISIPRILLIMGSLSIGIVIGLLYPAKKE